jgi:hypothetical protein
MLLFRPEVNIDVYFLGVLKVMHLVNYLHFHHLWIDGAVVIFFCFIPFFAFKEVSSVMGAEKIQNMFLRGKNS